MEKFKEDIITSKLREALKIDTNGIPVYGSVHKIKEFRDACTGYNMEEVIRNEYKNKLNESEIKIFLNNLTRI